MRNVEWSWLASLIFSLSAAGCGEPSHSEDLSQLTPADLCAKKCGLEVAPNCEKTPPDYESSCALLCRAKYDKFPNCVAAARSLDGCAIQRVSYGCEGGNLSIRPIGACAFEGAQCVSCTGSAFECL